VLIFYPKKSYEHFIRPVLSRFFFSRICSVPQVKNEAKTLPSADLAEIQEAVNDELKKVEKEEFSAVLQKW